MPIIDMYITFFAVVIAGVGNMIFTKTKLYKEHAKPMDGGRVLKDQKRVFGDNKTWIGFFGMIVINLLAQVCMGLVLSVFHLSAHSDFYNVFDNTILFNVIVGLLCGIAYVVLELPNSFIKRRLNIEPGTTSKEGLKWIFFVVDQVDSLFGVALVIFIFGQIPVWKYFAYIFIGAFTHIVVNLVLYKFKVRKHL